MDEPVSKFQIIGTTVYIALCVLLLGYTGRDDSHITYFVADQLAAGNGIVNYTGDAFEQSSSLLWTAVLAAFSLLFGTISANVGPLLSVTILLSCLTGTIWALRKFNMPPVAAVLACTSAPVIYWSLSGMENSLYLLLLAGFAFAAYSALMNETRSALASISLFSFLVTLVRPEGFIILLAATGLIVLAIFYLENQKKRNLLLVVVLGTGAAIGFRLAIGLDLFPNPVYLKQDISIETRFLRGANYFVVSAKNSPATAILSVGSFAASTILIFRGKVSGGAGIFGIVGVSLAAMVGGFAFASGGDWMENGRFLLPAYFFSILTISVLVKKEFRRVLVGLFLLASVSEVVYFSKKPWGGLPFWAPFSETINNFEPAPIDRLSSIHARDLRFAEKFLAVLEKDPREKISIASGQAGLVAYYIFTNSKKQLSFIDLNGLTSRHVFGCREFSLDKPGGNLVDLLDCAKIEPDYVFDIDYSPWDRLREWNSLGCETLIKDRLTIKTGGWKPPLVSRQYLVNCTN